MGQNYSNIWLKPTISNRFQQIEGLRIGLQEI